MPAELGRQTFALDGTFHQMLASPARRRSRDQEAAVACRRDRGSGGSRPISRMGLELSLKPFPSWKQHDLDETCATVFRQWEPLIDAADSVAVLLWVADGSEILEWDGDPGRAIDWASTVGFNNTEARPYGHNVTEDRAAVPYRADVPALTYADVRRVVRTVKAVGARLTGRPLTVGATFDAGPEFARSDFKYRRHPEILGRASDDGLAPMIQMVNAASVLEPDTRGYAGFPRGIAAGTSFGTFLGRQSSAYLEAMGFDYLWLSNGFGFSAFPWTPLGAVFDGHRFRSERAAAVRDDMLGFWRDLTTECRHPIEVRGTNFTVGIDIGGDAVPADEIYRIGRFRNPPPNSPWGPLNDDFGIEMSGYLSRIAEVPTSGFMFRYYVNDPWFWQNPWRDFYRREPFDIHLPLSVARIDANGQVSTAGDVQFLTVDTESGELDPRTGREVATHVLEALETPPDAAGPFVWLYPFTEYHHDLRTDPRTVAEPFSEDWYVTAAINAGLPLNTVVSTSNLAAALRHGALNDRVLVAPTRALTDECWDALVAAEVSVLAYGPLRRAGTRFAAMLGLTEAEGVDGDLSLTTELPADHIDSGGAPVSLHHAAVVSGGPVTTILTGRPPGTDVLASVSDGTTSRVYAAAATLRGTARVAWIRGSAPFTEAAVDHNGLPSPVPLDPANYVDPGALIRSLTSVFGYRLGFWRRTARSRTAVQSWHRHAGAYWLSGYLADTTTRVRLRLPMGAPLLTHHDAWYESGIAEYQFGRSYHGEARVFVDQEAAGVLSCREAAPFPYGMRRALQVTGLVEARLGVVLPRSVDARFSVGGRTVQPRVDDRGWHLLERVTGTLSVAWA
ncbi:hypothetical protein [Jiangella rhizosphaerae]|uniref:hypothetical protein n=1 Tax=Jiangella rhizosphaerae TaxID=2293569 RepID=UPI001F439742|nr:hypothetical protein [Jiangella rhizosphaerae]